MIEQDIYRHRFGAEDLESQRRLWRPICRYLQRYVNTSGVTLDLGAGFCHFINQIESRKKFAVDINAETIRQHAAADVKTLVTDGSALDGLPAGSVDTVFASNVYEHFPSREAVAESFQRVSRLLRPAGRFIIMQPNFAHCYRAYFDFFDHRLAFTHRGMAEGLVSSGFEIERLIPRFLPFTTKSRLLQAPWLVSLYLSFPLAWRILGAQMLIVARRS